MAWHHPQAVAECLVPVEFPQKMIGAQNCNVRQVQTSRSHNPLLDNLDGTGEKSGPNMKKPVEFDLF